MSFLRENIGTIIVGLIILFVLGSIVYNLISKKKQGKSTCGCGCEHCQNASMCHGSSEKK